MSGEEEYEGTRMINDEEKMLLVLVEMLARWGFYK